MSSRSADEGLWRLVGPNRYAVLVRMPWGTLEAAEVLVSTHVGWNLRRESRDPRWTAYLVGPAVLAIRFTGGLKWEIPTKPRRALCKS